MTSSGLLVFELNYAHKRISVFTFVNVAKNQLISQARQNLYLALETSLQKYIKIGAESVPTVNKIEVSEYYSCMFFNHFGNLFTPLNQVQTSSHFLVLLHSVPYISAG